MVDRAGAKRRHPLLWVPTLYFAMGTPNVAVSVVAAVMYTNLGISNADIALYTGAMYLPWTIKPLWAPLVEMFRSKRFFVLAMELVMTVTLGSVALALHLPHYIVLTLIFFWVTGFASATQDIAADGIFISSCSRREQAMYTGVQSMCWNLGRVVASGVLVWFTGKLHDERGLDWPTSWTVVMTLLAAIMGLSALWHARILPAGDKTQDAPSTVPEALKTFGETFTSFFEKKGAWSMIAFAFFYRFGEGFIDKIGPLFLLDARSAGGLGLGNADLGKIYGTFGSLAFVSGVLLGGLFSAKIGLRRALLPLCFAVNVPHVTYLYLSQVRPEEFGVITALVTIEKFGYGFGSVGQILYMMQEMAPGPRKTAHYAFATGLMALCMMLTGMMSGYLQRAVGHQTFFVIVMVLSAVPFVFTWLAPFHVAEREEAEREEAAR
jgi:MFS transporter, PAT family, beta-lactamase induction signal transducer AmpG